MQRVAEVTFAGPVCDRSWEVPRVENQTPGTFQVGSVEGTMPQSSHHKRKHQPTTARRSRWQGAVGLLHVPVMVPVEEGPRRAYPPSSWVPLPLP